MYQSTEIVNNLVILIQVPEIIFVDEPTANLDRVRKDSERIHPWVRLLLFFQQETNFALKISDLLVLYFVFIKSFKYHIGGIHLWVTCHENSYDYIYLLTLLLVFVTSQKQNL
jgi:hypothetical protein